jgi:hypothetical protein
MSPIGIVVYFIASILLGGLFLKKAVSMVEPACRSNSYITAAILCFFFALISLSPFGILGIILIFILLMTQYGLDFVKALVVVIIYSLLMFAFKFIVFSVLFVTVLATA